EQREQIRGKDDAEGSRPVPGPVHQHTVLAHPYGQVNDQNQHGHHGQQSQRALEHPGAPERNQYKSGRDRDECRQNQKLIRHEAPFPLAHHVSRSGSRRASISSEPLSWYIRYASTSRKAVTPKPMTMAVKMSAWGTGSV